MERKMILNKFQRHCAYCGCQISIDDMQVDHIIPKWKGGSDEANNLNPSCRMCNFYKGGNDIETFRKRLIVELDWDIGDDFHHATSCTNRTERDREQYGDCKKCARHLLPPPI